MSPYSKAVYKHFITAYYIKGSNCYQCNISLDADDMMMLEFYYRSNKEYKSNMLALESRIRFNSQNSESVIKFLKYIRSSLIAILPCEDGTISTDEETGDRMIDVVLECNNDIHCEIYKNDNNKRKASLIFLSSADPIENPRYVQPQGIMHDFTDIVDIMRYVMFLSKIIDNINWIIFTEMGLNDDNEFHG